MNSLQIAALVATTINVLLTLLVLRSNFHAKTTAAFTVWGASLTLWNLGTFFALGSPPRAQAYFWIQVLQLGVIFMPVSMLHLCLAIAEVRRTGLVAALYVVNIGFGLSLGTDWFLRDVRQLRFGYWMVPGPLFWVFLVCFAAECSAVIFLLHHTGRRATGVRKTQLDLMFSACVILTIFGVNDLLPILGYDRYPFTSLPFLPMANLSAIFFALVIAYSLLQHQFLDVHVTLSRAAAQTVRLIFVSFIGLGLLLLTESLAPEKTFTPLAFAATLIIVLASTSLASIIFPRLFGQGDDRLERRILGDRFEYQDRVRGFIESMIWYNNLEKMLDDLHELLTRTFRLTSYWLILRDENQRVFTLVRAHPFEPPRALPEFKAQSPVFEYFEHGRAEYLSVDAKYSRPGARAVERLARQQLSGFPAEFCFPLTSQNEPFGLFLVGPKNHGAAFTATDITLLVAMVKNLSLMVNQIRLKTQIAQTQELDLLGRMSKGMAHDLNNLLTPISALLQLANESSAQRLNEELLPISLRNIHTMRAYIQEALFFSEHLRPDLQLGRLDLAVEHAVEAAKASRKKLVEIVAETPGEVLVEMDEVLIERLIANLISNAIDASAPNSAVHVRLQRLAKSEAARDWLRVRVSDAGEGISRENLERVVKPYFTTKDRGDENRGFGLGLAICRKIVNLHGGNLSIASQIKKGTTVQVDLPSRQLQHPMPPVSALA